ncbi:MAG: FG-GAP-like repeat-containing protein [Steroidobacteraceae bacterium]
MKKRHYFTWAVCALGLGVGPNSFAAQVNDLFQPALTLPTHLQAQGIASGDVNGDGRTDVVVSGCGCGPNISSELYVFLGQPDGSLSNAPITYLTHGSGSVAIGDVTGDIRKDVVLVAPHGIEVYPQDNNGNLGAPIFYSTNYYNFHRLGDLNNDGRLDVFGLTDSINGIDNTADGGVLYQTGSGTFASPVTVAAPHGVNDDVELADVNGDGRTDVVVMNGYTAQPNISVLYQAANGALAAPVLINIGQNQIAHALGVGDINNDGRRDIVVSYGGYYSDAHLAIFRQNADGSFAAPESLSTLDAVGPIEVADLNNDGRNDIVILHQSSIGALLQNSNGTLAAEDNSLAVTSYVSHFQMGMVLDDINGDGLTDIAFAHIPGALMVRYGKPQNALPVATADSVTTACNTTTTIPVLKNDLDPDGDALTIVAVSAPSNGVATIVNEGKKIRYNPKNTFHGKDQFTYTISDGHGGFATALVTVTVNN